MKRLMLDYFSRWWWVLMLAGGLEIVMGWFVFPSGVHGKTDPSASFQFQIALFAGALLLSFDLQRGIARTVASLPLTARQIGRAWWLMTVGIPGIALSSLLFLGATLFHIFHPDADFPAQKLVIVSLFSLLWLGTMFTLIFNATRGMTGSGPRRVLNQIFGAFFGLLVGGSFLIFQNIAESPIKCALFVIIGFVMTVVGWLRAGQFVEMRAMCRIAGSQTQDPRGQHRAPVGNGGIPYLIGVTFVRTFAIGLAMVAMMPVFLMMQGSVKSWSDAIKLMGGVGNFFPFYFIIIFQMIPSLMQIRFLRTLPIPASQLSAVMLSMVLLPLFALGVLVAGVAGLSVGASASLAVMKSYTLTLAPASICILFFVWRGVGVQAFMALIFIMIAFQTVPLWLQMCFKDRVIPFSVMGVIAGASILLSYLLTCRLLTHSSRVYRVQANTLTGFNWGVSR